MEEKKIRRDNQTTAIINDRLSKKEFIQVKYPDKLKENMDKLCPSCIWWNNKTCRNNLIPVTTTGENCQYYGTKPL